MCHRRYSYGWLVLMTLTYTWCYSKRTLRNKDKDNTEEKDNKDLIFIVFLEQGIKFVNQWGFIYSLSTNKVSTIDSFIYNSFLKETVPCNPGASLQSLMNIIKYRMVNIWMECQRLKGNGMWSPEEPSLIFSNLVCWKKHNFSSS